MSIQKILKAYIICPGESVRDMMHALQLWGGMETIRINEDHVPEQDSSMIDDLAKVKFIIQVLDSFSSGRSLWRRLKEGLPVVQVSRLKSIHDEFDIARDYEDIRRMDNRINSIGAGINDIDKELEMLRKIATLNLSAADLIFDSVDVQIVALGQNSRPIDFIEKAFVEKIEISNGALAAVFSMKEDSGQLLQQFTEAGAHRVVLPEKLAPASRISELEQEKNIKFAEISEIEKEIKEKYVSLKPGYEILATSIENSMQLEEELTRASQTSYTSIISGWLPAGADKELARLIKEMEPDSYLRLAQPDKDDDPPVLLSNSSFSDPFEMVTNLYGTPRYGWIDPTPFLAPFFAFFFGLCLTDAGYGIVIAGVAVWARKKLKLNSSLNRFMLLMFWGGMFSIITGALTGGWFGNILSSFGPAKKLRILDPLEKPQYFLYFSVLLGYIQVLLGVSISFFKNIKEGLVREGIYTVFPWLLILVSLPLVFIPGIFAVIGKALIIFGIAIVVLMSGYSSRNIFARLGSGLYNLYGGTDYFKDMISYSRLFALGMGTAILAMAVNELSLQAAGIPVVGYLLLVVVFLGGHIFNIVMSLLSGYIHTSRLQYVEFFTKFFQGGGRMFSPFEWKHKKFNISE